MSTSLAGFSEVQMSMFIARLGRQVRAITIGLCLFAVALVPSVSSANPWNGKVVFQAFWWDLKNENYPGNWYTYLAKLAPRLRELGFDGLWIPFPGKGASGGYSMGYDPFDHYDLGDKEQRETVRTKFGTKDQLLRLIAVAHANGLDVYPDIVLNHMNGGGEDEGASGNKFKSFKYAGFAGPATGRWPKSHNDFHPNSGHNCNDGNTCGEFFGGPDICYLDPSHGGGGGGQYMRDHAREWMVWLKKQLDVDGFRFDAVKHFPAYVVEDVLFNSMGAGIEYFCAGEYVVGAGETQPIDEWAALTKGRCGALDFSFREALLNMVKAGGFFDMGSLPNFQQTNRLKTVPFVNSHDTWRGPFHDSHFPNDGSDELLETLNPDDPRADIAYAAAFAIDGSPVVYYEDLIVNFGDDRNKADPDNFKTRDYLVNLIWAHQKLDFKDGAYKVPFRGSADLLVLERAGKALIAVNDNGVSSESATIQTSFGPNVRLHDYSGSNPDDVTTDGQGRVKISVPKMSYAIWGRPGRSGGFNPPKRRTTQEFQLDDDLGDNQVGAPGYGGKIVPDGFRTAGSIWAAAGSTVTVKVYTDGARTAQVRVLSPDDTGAKSNSSGQHEASGPTSNVEPIVLEFNADREGYHQLTARLTDAGEAPTRAYVKVEYEAPRQSDKF
jgi:alpha-amylase